MLKNKFLNLSLSLAFLVLSGCSSEQAELPSLVNNDMQQVQAQAAKTIKLSLTKENTKETKKSESTLTNKKSKGTVKKVEKLEINFIPPSKKNDIDSKSAVTLARFALNSMNGAQSFESGYKISLKALETIESQGVYTAKLGLKMAKAGMFWETCFKASAATLKNISEERPNTPAEACNLVSSIMSNTKSYEEGAKLGYAALEVIGNTDNQVVRLIVDTTVKSAKSGQYWEDIYKTLQNGLTEIKRL